MKSSVCCYRIYSTIVADSFIHIGNDKRTGVIKHTLPFIPGSVIRGSLGNCLLRISGQKSSASSSSSSELYNLLFAEELGKSSDIFFKHCYPLHLRCINKNKNQHHSNGGVFVPSMRNLFKCQNRQCGRLYETFAPPLQCESCGKSVKPFIGYICINCGELSAPHPVSMNRISCTAINRDRYSSEEIEETVERTQAFPNDIIINNNIHSSSPSPSSTITHKERHGLLHTIDVIERGTRFALDIILASSCYPFIDKLMSLLIRGLEDEGIGGSKSRGYGDVSVKDTKVEEITPEAIEKRSEYISKNSRMFSVHLLSPVVLDNTRRNVEPATVLEGARRAYSWCFKEGRPSLPDLVKLNQIFSYDVFGGWTLKEERKRRPAVSISSGSVFSFEPASGKEEDETQTQMLRKALAALEYYAIGGYKPHGYGQIRIMSS